MFSHKLDTATIAGAAASGLALLASLAAMYFACIVFIYSMQLGPLTAKVELLTRSTLSPENFAATWLVILSTVVAAQAAVPT